MVALVPKDPSLSRSRKNGKGKPNASTQVSLKSNKVKSSQGSWEMTPYDALKVNFVDSET